MRIQPLLLLAAAVLLGHGLVFASDAIGDTTPNSETSRAPNPEVRIEPQLQKAQSYIRSGTLAQENTQVTMGQNYVAAKQIFSELYTNVVINHNISNKVTEAYTYRILGEYGWLLYRASGADLASRKLGTNMLQLALNMRPTNANLNVKMALVYYEQCSDVSRPHDLAFLKKATELLERAVRTDDTYAYAYWCLSQCYGLLNDKKRARECLERYVSLYTKNDPELWLYDEGPFKERLDIARKLLTEAAATPGNSAP